MKLAIQNMKSSTHSICRTNGLKLAIPPGKYIIFDTEDEREFYYWSQLNYSVADRIGIKIISNETDINNIPMELIYIKSNTCDTVSILDKSVSPVAEQIAKQTFVHDEPTKNNGSYTEEELLQMDKEHLMNICDNFGISYKKNNSVKTLVTLILGSDKI